MIRLAEHPRIVAVKDCAYDLLGTQKVLARTELAYYAGCDEHVLALYAPSAVPATSARWRTRTRRHFRAILDAFDGGGHRTRRPACSNAPSPSRS
jgi:4-hydroxy-tetrahydrodipicolinate synthase